MTGNERGAAIAQIFVGLTVIVIVIGIVIQSMEQVTLFKGRQQRRQAMEVHEREIQLVLSTLSNCTCNFRFRPNVTHGQFRFNLSALPDSIPVSRLKTYADAACSDADDDVVLAQRDLQRGIVKYGEMFLKNIRQLESSAAFRADLEVNTEINAAGGVIGRRALIPLSLIANVVESTGDVQIESCIFKEE